jgi:hypothetical protein
MEIPEEIKLIVVAGRPPPQVQTLNHQLDGTITTGKYAKE